MANYQIGDPPKLQSINAMLLEAMDVLERTSGCASDTLCALVSGGDSAPEAGTAAAETPVTPSATLLASGVLSAARGLERKTNAIRELIGG